MNAQAQTKTTPDQARVIILRQAADELEAGNIDGYSLWASLFDEINSKQINVILANDFPKMLQSHIDKKTVLAGSAKRILGQINAGWLDKKPVKAKFGGNGNVLWN